MSIEKNYSGSFEDSNYVVPLIEGLAVHIDWHIQKLKSDLKARFTNDEFDVEYINLHLDDIAADIGGLLLKKLNTLKALSDEKSKDFRDRKE